MVSLLKRAHLISKLLVLVVVDKYDWCWGNMCIVILGLKLHMRVTASKFLEYVKRKFSYLINPPVGNCKGILASLLLRAYKDSWISDNAKDCLISHLLILNFGLW